MQNTIGMDRRSEHAEDLGCPAPLLRPKQVADWLSVSPSEVTRLRKDGQLPYIPLGKSTRHRNGKIVDVEHVRYDPHDVKAFLRERRVESR